MDSTHPQSGDFRTPDRWNSVPVPERVAERAHNRHTVDDNGCWISTYSTASHGYAQIGWDEGGKRHMVLAHRASWVHVNGQLPLGMTLDHTCKTRPCVNPDHLRMLPNYENARRTDGRDWPMGECAQGHPNTMRVNNSRLNKRGGRRTGTICAECKRLYSARGNWRASHGDEPFPAELRLRSEEAA